jgi:predicted DNA binding CopG/RHH family protein
MKKKIKLDSVESYNESPEEMDFDLESAKIVKDLLPPPHLLVMRKVKKVKVTMDLPENDVAFFKDSARRLGVSYQSMIRSLLGSYVSIVKARTGKR